MEQSNKDLIMNRIDAVKPSVMEDVRRIYDTIQSKMEEVPIQRAGSEIAQSEANDVNQYIQKLKDELKETAIRAVVEIGFPEYYTESMWIMVTQSVKLPKVQLCQTEVGDFADIGATTDYNESAEYHRNVKSGKESYSAKRDKSLFRAGVGLALDGIGHWLMVPSFTKNVVVTIGTVMAVTGGSMAAYYHHRSNEETNYIDTQDNKREEMRAEYIKTLKKICDSQCELNTRIICGWVDTVKQAVVEVCEERMPVS